MIKNGLEYRQYAAFINREKDLNELRRYIDKEPSEILFLHGPKSSGKTTLLHKFFEQIQQEQHLEVKFLNLRETFTNVYDDFLKAFFHVEKKGERQGKISSDINIGFFKISAEVERKILEKRVDPFKVMKAELTGLAKKGIKPVLIIDELQALDKVYIDNDKERLLITALFNFFVALTKESHLAHIIIASSDGYFLNKIYTDSRLKKSSAFYKVDYLQKEDVREWLLNLEKYSRIKDYKLMPEDIEKLWDTVGGSMWEIQYLLSPLAERPMIVVLEEYKKKMLGLITDYIVTVGREKREKILKHFVDNDLLSKRALDEKDEELIRQMVRDNILYFDPTEAIFYPQGRSYQWGIRMYFESPKD